MSGKSDYWKLNEDNGTNFVALFKMPKLDWDKKERKKEWKRNVAIRNRIADSAIIT